MGVLSVFLYNQKGNEGDSVSKKPTERCGHRLRAASGGQETIGNTPEPDSRTLSDICIGVRMISRLPRHCALSRNESEEKSHAFLFECGWYRGNIPSRNVRFDVPGLFY